MNKIRSLIIDDELNNSEILRTLLSVYCDDVAVIGCANSADVAIELIRLHTPDLIFLDIQMPEKSGFEVIKAFDDIHFEIIFTTAYDQYGIQAIKFSALDYLLKPIDIDELKFSVNRAKEKISAKERNRKFENLVEYINAGPKTIPKIALPTLQEIRYVKVSEIIRCEASNNYTTVFFQCEDLLVCRTLKEFDELLKPFGFIRSHQSHLVNPDFVKSFLREDGGVLLMKDEIKIPISRQKREIVKKALE